MNAIEKLTEEERKEEIREERHCKKVMQSYFNNNQPKRKIEIIKVEKLSSIQKGKLKKLEGDIILPSENRTNKKSSVNLFSVYKKEVVSPLKIIAKKYILDSSEHSNLFPMFIEGESLKLCNKVYNSQHKLSKLIPKFYGYDDGTLFKEYVEGESLTNVIIDSYTAMNNINQQLRNIDERLNKSPIDRLNPEEMLKEYITLEQKSKLLDNNIKNLIKSTVITLADFHESIIQYRRNTQKHVVHTTNNYSHSHQIADLSLELSHQLGIGDNMKEDREWWMEIFQNFSKSPASLYLDNTPEHNLRFLIGDYYSDNILISPDYKRFFDKSTKSKKENLIDIDGLCSKFEKGHKKLFAKLNEQYISENGESLEGKFDGESGIMNKLKEEYYSMAKGFEGNGNISWQQTLRLFDLGKCMVGPVALDLNDLLNEPYPGFAYKDKLDKRSIIPSTFKDGYIDDYIEESNRLRSNSPSSFNKLLDHATFKKNYKYCSIPRLLRSIVNEKVVKYKIKYMNNLRTLLTNYEGFEDLKKSLNKRNLLNNGRYNILKNDDT